MFRSCFTIVIYISVVISYVLFISIGPKYICFPTSSDGKFVFSFPSWLHKMILHYYYFSTSLCGLRVSDSNGLALGSSMFILIITFLPILVIISSSISPLHTSTLWSCTGFCRFFLTVLVVCQVAGRVWQNGVVCGSLACLEVV